MSLEVVPAEGDRLLDDGLRRRLRPRPRPAPLRSRTQGPSWRSKRPGRSASAVRPSRAATRLLPAAPVRARSPRSCRGLPGCRDSATASGGLRDLAVCQPRVQVREPGGARGVPPRPRARSCAAGPDVPTPSGNACRIRHPPHALRHRGAHGDRIWSDLDRVPRQPVERIDQGLNEPPDTVRGRSSELASMATTVPTRREESRTHMPKRKADNSRATAHG